MNHLIKVQGTTLLMAGLLLMGMGKAFPASPPLCMDISSSGSQLNVCSGDGVPVGIDLYIDGQYYDTTTNVPVSGVNIGMPVTWCTVYAAAWDMPTNDGHSAMSIVVINPANPGCNGTVPVVTTPVVAPQGVCIDSTAYVAGSNPLAILSQTTHCF